ncbi:aldehyde dehydrogenase family protein [Streptomyces thinghirensis]|uniref:Aldehyde dehydrogenase n=1 Tax=Streptomyces thinghirensis TaxID=551547 RepID=A0ABP9T6W8_9ACTN
MASETQLLLIGGEPVAAASGQIYEKTSALTGRLVSVASAGGPDDVDRAVASASQAFSTWSNMPAEDRAAMLRRASEILNSRSAQIATTMTEEIGATHGWGMFNCMLAAGILTAAADLSTQVRDETLVSGIPGLQARAVRRPKGVVAAIAPWNAPVILGTRAVAAPLALGNTVVFKASEECPRTHAAIVQALIDAGAPYGTVNLITNRPEDGPAVVERLIDHPDVRHVNFTGSSHVGRLIAVRAAQNLKPTLLELGGKAPFVVCEDADLDEAASAASFGAFMNSGQICMSTERVIVNADVAERFADLLASRAGTLTLGDPTDPTTAVGPVVSLAAAARLEELIADAVKRGARVLVGGRVNGLMVEPTVLVGVTPAMRLYREESFGPVVTVTAVVDDEEAIRLANDTEYGLSAAVFSRDVQRAEAIAARIDSGICHINGATVHDEPHVPFGGIKDSGWGRFGGTYAIDEFMDVRWVTSQDGSRHYPI